MNHALELMDADGTMTLLTEMESGKDPVRDLEEYTKAMAYLVEMGMVRVVGTDPDGENIYSLTPKGRDICGWIREILRTIEE